MKKIFSNILFLTISATTIGIIGIIHSIIVQDFIWFQRSGSLIVGIGIILLSRPFIIDKDLLLNIRSSETLHNINSPENFHVLNEQVPDYVLNDQASRKAIGWLGPLISFIGTVIWGYADLLILLLK